jgi:ubiquinol-cytochrome c reductase cytochrome b subunit
VVGLHIWALHVPGNNNPTGVTVKGAQDTVPFHPYYTMKDAFAVVVFLIVYAAFAFFSPNYMGHAINYQEANPLVTPTHIVPEWYYLPFYAILRAIPDKLGGVIAMFGSILILFVLPWLDTSRVRSGTYRPLFKQFFWIFVLVCIGLGYLGSKPAEGWYIIFSRLLTFWYFFHFLVILPLLGLLESPKPLPSSISDDVLAKQKPAAVPAE